MKNTMHYQNGSDSSGQCSGSPRPWANLIDGESPWDEHKAFEDWIKSKIHPDTVVYFDNAPSGFSSYLYAALAAEFDKANVTDEPRGK